MWIVLIGDWIWGFVGYGECLVVDRLFFGLSGGNGSVYLGIYLKCIFGLIKV